MDFWFGGSPTTLPLSNYKCSVHLCPFGASAGGSVPRLPIIIVASGPCHPCPIEHSQVKESLWMAVITVRDFFFSFFFLGFSHMEAEVFLERPSFYGALK